MVASPGRCFLRLLPRFCVICPILNVALKSREPSPFRGRFVPPVSSPTRNHRSSRSNTWHSSSDLSFGSEALAELRPRPAPGRCARSEPNVVVSVYPWMDLVTGTWGRAGGPAPFGQHRITEPCWLEKTFRIESPCVPFPVEELVEIVRISSAPARVFTFSISVLHLFSY